MKFMERAPRRARSREREVKSAMEASPGGVEVVREADLSTSLRSGRDDKFVASSGRDDKFVASSGRDDKFVASSGRDDKFVARSG